MPRIRSVKPSYWDDIKLSKVSRDARLLFISMWNFADDLGVLIGDITWLKSKAFPYDKIELSELQKWVDELINMKFIVSILRNEESYLLVKNFKKHQKINKPNYDDVYIDSEELKAIYDQSRINHGSITDQSRINPGGIGKEGIGKEGIGGPITDFSMMEIFYKKWDDYKLILNGQAKFLSEPIFEEWKEFVLFVRDNQLTELFNCKFISPIDWGKLRKEKPFTKEIWLPVIKKILSTGVKPEHNLFFRIPQFMEYCKKEIKDSSNKEQPKLKL